MNISTSIIPNKQVFAKKKTEAHELNLKAICVFIATGFFMDDDTFWKDLVCLSPAHNHKLDDKGFLISSTPNFKWHYEPRNLTFDSTLEEYIDLLKRVTKEQVGDSSVILPLSGGLDSRSQALIFKELKNPIQAYSYAFENGFAEHNIAQTIANHCGFKFKAFTIFKGYLWKVIEELSSINKCYSEFTHPRQMAILPELKRMQGVFSLGHWGDVLFDRGISKDKNDSDVIPYLLNKMVKPKGEELAAKLWQFWGLPGDFNSFLIERIKVALKAINIDNVSAKVRAFKTSQWAHRWTTTNLSVFENAHKITLPYYDNRVSEFICSVPEEYLADRKLQIAHIQTDKKMSGITWQQHNPFNLNTFQYNKAPYNLPYRIISKLRRLVNEAFGTPYIQRNWELQFLGESNDQNLKQFLFNNEFNQWIPKTIVNEFYENFRIANKVQYSHAISMLLTLSVWYQKLDSSN